MNSVHIVQIFWVLIFFFSLIILFFVWAKSMVIMRLFAKVHDLLSKMDTLYDEEPQK
ncbi:MAG: hypothetical protein LBH98_09780 [Chitinispirillales bacterium]|jgi:hypothetical protein|nr:hypothetical protein [Chitinispirillales bacterium]